MGRLIDADTLIETLKKYKFGAISNDTEREYVKKTVLSFVKEQPIAYDVEKVVAQLTNMRNDKAKTCSQTDISICNRYTDCGVCLMERVIDIVKSGGVE